MIIPLLLLHLASLASAFTFEFSSRPTQCSSLSLVVSDGGQGPFRLLLIPVGTLETGVEIRRIVDVQFDGTEYTLPPLAFPGNSQFVASLSDATGMDNGVVSVRTIVAPGSNDQSCLSTSSVADFFFFLAPTNLTQCGTNRVSWNEAAIGTVSILGVIPGGRSFQIPIPSGTPASGFDWTVNIPQGTEVILLAGDSRGRANGGSQAYTVGAGSDSCLGGGALSTTAAPAAGAIDPTGSSGGSVTGSGSPSPTGGSSGSNSGGGGSSNKTGLIVGVTIGVVAALLLLIGALLFLRRRQQKKVSKSPHAKEVDLLHGGGGQDVEAPPGETHDQMYEPEPFIPPPIAGTATQGSRRESLSSFAGQTTMSDHRAPETATSSGRDRKSLTPAPMRPVNIIQHNDGGAVPDHANEEPETVELPPSYASVPSGSRPTA